MAVTYPIAAQQFIEEDKDVAEVEAAVRRFMADYGSPGDYETFLISEPLHAALMASFVHALSTLAEGPVRLGEVKVKAETGFEMVLYPNESKHAGFPHVRVQLRDGPINISIEDEPRVVAGKRKLRGEAAAVRAVKEHKESLLGEWHATKPDDQKLTKSANSAR